MEKMLSIYINSNVSKTQRDLDEIAKIFELKT